MDEKTVFGLISAIVSFGSFLPYIHSVWRGKTRPHLFTWLVWTVLTTMIFIIQLIEKAGAGAWGTGVIAMTCLVILFFSLFKGEKTGTRTDWAAFVASLLGIPLWLFTKDPTLAAIFVTAIDVLAFWPTVNKTWRTPHSENLLYYFCWLIKYPTGFLAIESMSVANAVYPLTWSIIGMIYVPFLLYRRRTLQSSNAAVAP